MTAKVKTAIEKHVDRQFKALNATPGQDCINHVLGGRLVGGFDLTAEQKADAGGGRNAIWVAFMAGASSARAPSALAAAAAK